MSANTFTLGGQPFTAATLEFKVLRRVLPAINRVGPTLARNVITEAVMADLADVICAGAGITVEQFDAMPVKAHELGLAFNAVVLAAGLEAKQEGASGEASVADGTGTTSTLISPPASVGPGTTSTE